MISTVLLLQYPVGKYQQKMTTKKPKLCQSESVDPNTDIGKKIVSVIHLEMVEPETPLSGVAVVEVNNPD